MRTRRPRTPDDRGEMAEIALEYAIGGARLSACSVIPVKRDKTPYVNWKDFQDQRADEPEIRGWFKTWPSANLAVVTGAISNLVVVDIDGHRDSGFDLLRRHGVEWPTTRMVETGRGGVHLWFAHPGVHTRTLAGVLKEEGLSIDVRGDGGYSVVPPSVHENGKPYRFIGQFKGALPILPSTITRLLEEDQPRTERPAHKGNAAQDAQVVETLADTGIVGVIQREGVDLTREADDRYRGICPFHGDTTPSLVVTPSAGLFHCFGCGAAGNAIHFVRRVTGCTFAQALKSLRSTRQ